MIQKVVERVQGILLKPAETWDVIKVESTSVTQLYKEYLVILAGIPAISGFLGSLFKGAGFFNSLFWGILFYVFSIAGVWLSATIVKYLAENFKIDGDETRIHKLVAYSSTALFASGIFFLIPPLYWFSILGLYGFYLYVTGIPKLLICPEDEKMNFTVISILAIAFVWILCFAFAALISGIENSYLSV